MIVAALLMLAVPQEGMPADEILVSGKLLNLKVSLKTNRKHRATACAIDRTSGDAAFDRTACETTVRCFNQGPRASDAVSACVHDAMLAYARGQANAPATEETN